MEIIAPFTEQIPKQTVMRITYDNDRAFSCDHVRFLGNLEF